MRLKINSSVDGVPVTMVEARMVIIYLMKHRKEFHSDDEVRNAFYSYIRQIRGGVKK